MKSKLIYKYVPTLIQKSDDFVTHSQSYKHDIDEYWSSLMNSGKQFINGELYTIRDMIKKANGLNIYLEKTSYAHYLFSMNNGFSENNSCHSIASNILPLTLDNYYVLAIMNSHTSLPKKIKFIGGALAEEDSRGNIVDLERCAIRETKEEIGIEISKGDKITPQYIITRKNLSFVNILHEVKFSLTKTIVDRKFDEYKKYLGSTNEDIELSNLYFLKNDKIMIKNFIENYRDNFIDYLEEVLLILVGEIEPGDILSHELLHP